MKKELSEYSKLTQRIIVFLALIFPTCDSTCKRLSKSKDEKLSLKDKILVKMHLSICNWCTNFDTQIDIISELIRKKAKETEQIYSKAVQLSSIKKEQIQKLLVDQLNKNQ